MHPTFCDMDILNGWPAEEALHPDGRRMEEEPDRTHVIIQ
jgi:hypothetical protein